MNNGKKLFNLTIVSWMEALQHFMPEVAERYAGDLIAHNIFNDERYFAPSQAFEKLLSPTEAIEYMQIDTEIYSKLGANVSDAYEYIYKKAHGIPTMEVTFGEGDVCPDCGEIHDEDEREMAEMEGDDGVEPIADNTKPISNWQRLVNVLKTPKKEEGTTAQLGGNMFKELYPNAQVVDLSKVKPTTTKPTYRDLYESSPFAKRCTENLCKMTGISLEQAMMAFDKMGDERLKELTEIAKLGDAELNK